MAGKLAKLDDVKAALGETGEGLDELLTAYLRSAAAMTEQAAGLMPGALRRQVDVVEYPWSSDPDTDTIYLGVRPIESVSAVKQLYVHGTTSTFNAAESLDEGEDYVVISRNLGGLRRVGYRWLACPHYIRVTYTGGYIDPDDEAVVGALTPPDDVQLANVQQTILIYQARDTAGVSRVDAGQAGSFVPVEMQPHPALLAAAARYRRLLA